MILGGGAVAAGPQALALSERLGTAIVTTVAGKGIVPQTHPHSLGATLNDPATRKVLDQADLILAVGTELASPDHFGDTLPIHARLIRIDIDPNVLVRDNPPDIGICSDAQAALAGLLDATSHLKRPCWIDAAAILEGYRSRIREQKPSHAAFLDVLERSLDPDAIVVTDMTQIAYTGNNYFASSFPRSWLHPVGFGTLGYAMPAAIGAKLADPRRQVVAVVGDYGFGFTAQELATASDLGISLPILIWNNGGLGQIASDMDKLTIPRLGVDIAPPDFASLARAYGAAYREPGALSDLPSLLEEARDVGGPTLIEIPPRLTR
jgi:thiamine pyrophosphate-dependent acetolactate synthase large subunit-like protein